MRIILLALLLLRASQAAPLGNPELERRLTLKVHDTPIVQVLETIADDLDKSLLVLADTKGEVSLDATELRSSDVLTRVLRGRPGGPIFVLTPDFLVVAPPDRIRNALTEQMLATPIKRRTFHLTTAPADKVVEFLKGQYLAVQFKVDGQSFLAVGPERDLRSIASELPNLDRIPEPLPLVTMRIKLPGPGRFEALEKLRERFYSASFELDGEWLTVHAYAFDADSIREAVISAASPAESR